MNEESEHIVRINHMLKHKTTIKNLKRYHHQSLFFDHNKKLGTINKRIFGKFTEHVQSKQ